MAKKISKLLESAVEKIDIQDAQILLAHALKKPREFIIAHPDFFVPWLPKFRFENLVAKKIQGIPVAYLIGHKEFYGLDFLVNKFTLIPRPETEVLVEKTLEQIQNIQKQNKLVLIDVGTGSGCIPIAIYKAIEKENVRPIHSIAFLGTDISGNALEMAKKNTKKHFAKITFFKGNLLEPMTKNSEPVASASEVIITANLPYLTQEQFDTEPSIQHEPQSALVTEDDGLKLYKELLLQIKKLLNTYNLILTTFFEIDPSQTEKLSDYIKTIFPNSKTETFKDGMNNDRILRLTIDKTKNRK